MLTPTKANILLSIMCFLVFSLQENIAAQIVIGTPNLGFSQACASDSFNTYSTTFIFSPENGISGSNQFSVELSDADGDFTNSTIIYTSAAGAVNSSPATLNFSIPEDTAGENYRIKIKSSAPVASSSRSAPFAAYFKTQDSPFTINNLVSTGAYCTGGSYLLSIDNPGTGSNDSPLLYPNLTFQWFRETSPTTSVFVADGPTLTVTQEGTYFVETNYGTCTSNSFSNRVTISEAVSGEASATIASSLGNPFCPEQGATTLSTISGNSYQWFKDNEIIPDATNQMYQALESGIYSVQVDLGDCSATGSIPLVSELFDSSINVDEINSILEDETLMVIVTTNANSPLFDWYLDDVFIGSSRDGMYEATELGDYRVVVQETSGCQASVEYSFRIQEGAEPFPDVINIPNVISPNGDGINDTWVLPLEFVTGTNTDIKILDERGKLIFHTISYQNNWPETQPLLTSINVVYYYIITPQNSETRKGTITLVK